MIKKDVIEHMGVLTLARPWVHNAVNRQMIKELGQHLQAWRDDREIKMVILTGEGNSFCSGGDIEEFNTLSKAELSACFQQMKEVLLALHYFPKPTVAALNGTAVGGGCELASACDFRLAHPAVQLGFVQIRLGITTGWGGANYLFKLLPRQKALDMLLSGERMSGTEAHKLGFVDKIFPTDHFFEHVLTWCRRFARQPLDALLLYKQTAQQAEDPRFSFSEKVTAEVERCIQVWAGPVHQQSMIHFLQKIKKK
ncbi:enoyl-CoA hydratase/carnithine racemase [Caldalkalibacillus uzonensis]|uniref:Enoyl-CoA hydratase/carnithine racemase n=1 Tax=Caldalkalibacillus uzonensis TaxID=353224 RepID=A0ABU0CS00_9BACI|nr:enoyl-CoA hydratase/isomerase family protein [Caldalkalibacillus uzonensis]MDQ0339203.1 enoyl-CoA hydratase/carnithine racemase [Caldalkalibacillus uzonensis]